MQHSGINLDNYSGLWCVEPVRFGQMVSRVNNMNLAAHISAQEPQEYDAKAQHFDTVEGGSIAVVSIRGTMTKGGSSLSSGGSTVRARRAIRQAEQDRSVDSIVIRFDTPGGTVAGTDDLANEIQNTSKKTIGFAEDLCASAGMWAIAQCDEVYANSETALIGSIGTFMAVYDISAALEEEQVKTILIKAGQFKGGGFPGVEVSDEQIAEWQKMIDATQGLFTKAIANGRGLNSKQAEQLVTGLVYMADEAQQLKLIDGIKSFDQVVSETRSQHSARKVASMAKETETPSAATFKEIVAACPGIDAKDAVDALFITDCLNDGMSAADANELYCETLRDRLKASEARNAELTAEIKELKASQPKKKGVPAVGTDPKSSSVDPKADFEAAVKEEQKGGKSRAEAVRAVNKKQPELREAFVAAVNA